MVAEQKLSDLEPRFRTMKATLPPRMRSNRPETPASRRPPQGPPMPTSSGARSGLPGGKQLNCDFSVSTASAITRSTLSLRELLGVGLPLLRRLDAETRSSVASLLTPFSVRQS